MLEKYLINKFKMKKLLIEKLEKDLNEFYEESLNEFKDFIESESSENCKSYYDIERYVMKLDWQDPSYTVWFNKWIEYILWLLRKTKEVNRIDFNDFKYLVESNLWINKEDELKDYLYCRDYSDALENYIDLLHAMWLSYTISELTDEWTVAYRCLWIDWDIPQIDIIQSYFNFDYDSYQELYDELYKIESLVINF